MSDLDINKKDRADLTELQPLTTSSGSTAGITSVLQENDREAGMDYIDDPQNEDKKTENQSKC